MKQNDAITIGLLTFPVAIAALSMGGFACGATIGLWHMPVALALALAAAKFFTPERKTRTALWMFGWIAAALVLAGLNVAYTNADAASYYRIGTYLLADGWNPLRVTEVDQVSGMVDGWCRPWPIAFLPRMAWLFGAAFYRWCGFLEVADAFNIIVLFASFLAVGDWLHERFGLTGWRRIMLTAVFCLSPHVVGGLFGGSFDAAGYSAFLIALAAADRKKYVPLVLAAVVMGGLKFTGVVFAVIIFAGALALDLRNWRKIVGVGAVSGVLILLLNASPYITSMKNHGGPFYPSHSFIASERFEDARNPITCDIGYMNNDAREIGYLGRFCWAYVSQNLVKAYYRRKTGRADFNPDFRVSAGIEGFGAFFRVLLVLSLIGWLFVRNRTINVFLGVIFATVLIQPAFYSGIARYVPQFYLFPWIVALGLVERFKGRRAFRHAQWGGVGVLSAYTVSVLAYPASFFALQWITSVQNLQIANAVRQDPKAVVASTWNYPKIAYGKDFGIPPERIIDDAGKAGLVGMHEYSSYFSYGSVLTSKEIEGFYRLNHVMSKNDPSVKASRNAENARFFVKDFLPRELLRLPLRIWQTVRLRSSQFLPER